MKINKWFDPLSLASDHQVQRFSQFAWTIVINAIEAFLLVFITLAGVFIVVRIFNRSRKNFYTPINFTLAGYLFQLSMASQSAMRCQGLSPA